jgi:hypothetical protein
MKESVCGTNPSFLCLDPPDLLLDGFACRLATELSGGRIRGFPCLHHSIMVINAHLWPGDEQLGQLLMVAVQRHSLTPLTWPSSSYVLFSTQLIKLPFGRDRFSLIERRLPWPDIFNRILILVWDLQFAIKLVSEVPQKWSRQQTD